MTDARIVTLQNRPKGHPTDDDLTLETRSLPEPGPGEVTVRVQWLSLDPYMRGRMDPGPSYADPVEIGDVMTGQGVGEVIASNADGITVGDTVTGMTGWASHANLKAGDATKVDPDRAPTQTCLGVLGMPGLTAWAGLTRILKVQAGETVVISAATGAVGTVAGQIAKSRGARVIGVAGGPEKCALATGEMGYDACIDHHAHDTGDAMAEALKDTAPDGIDCYFENVGGHTLSGVVPNMGMRGRIAICGMVAWYSDRNSDQALPLPAVWRRILVQRLVVEGFLVFDHWDAMGEFQDEVAPMVRDGRLHYREHVTEGLENARAAFVEMLEGGNTGKTLVKVAD